MTEVGTQSAPRKKANIAKKLRCNTLVCVLENPSNPENACAVVRNIDALGVGKLYVVSDKIASAVFDRTRKGKRGSRMHDVSASALKYVYVRVFSSTAACMAHLKTKNYTSIATSPHNAAKINLTLDSDFTRFRKLAIWFGNEAKGLSQEVVTSAHACVQIQMIGIIESLNLAVATGIVLHIITQQRRKFHSDQKPPIASEDHLT
jgi:tRNA (guanosine-2'-O-)-methyltransferase